MREIDFEKVNKFGYDEQGFEYPITSFSKHDVDLCKETAMITSFHVLGITIHQDLMWKSMRNKILQILNQFTDIAREKEKWLKTILDLI